MAAILHQLRKQTAVGGGHPSLVPRFPITPADREQIAELLLAAHRAGTGSPPR